MSDNLNILLIILVAGLIVLTPAAYFGGKTGVIIAVAILTAISCYFLMYALGLGKSFANSNAPTSFKGEILLPLLGFAALYVFIGYGTFCFSQVVHGVAGYKIKWLVCSVILVGVPFFLFAKEVIRERNTHLKNYKTDIVIAHPIDFPIQIDQLRFFNSKTKKSSTTHSRYIEDDFILSKIEGLNSENESLQSFRYYPKALPRLIPISFDAFELSWYSVLEQRFYKDVFPLDQEKLKIRKDYEGQMIISDMLINILPNGNVDLLKKDYDNDYVHTAAYNDVAFTTVEGQSLEAVWELFTPIGREPEGHKKNLKRDFAKIEAGTQTRLSPEEILSFRSVYAYGIDIKIKQVPNEVIELKDIKIIDFYLNQYIRKADFLREINTKPLPSFIRINLMNYGKDERRRIAIAFDKKALFNAYKTFAETHKEAVSFYILVDVEDLNKSEIYLKSKDAKMALQHYRIYER